MPIGEKMPDNVEKKATVETLPSKQENQTVESLSDVPEFAQEKISDEDTIKKQEEIENLGIETLRKAKKEYQPKAESYTKYKTLFDGFAARSREIVEKARIGIREAAEGAVIGGMLAATAGIAEGNVLEKPSGKTQEGVKIELKIPLRKNIVEKNLESEKDETETEKEGEAFEWPYELEAEFYKKRIIERINSDDYLKKLTIEFDGNEELAKEEQKKRIENLKTVKIELKDTTDDVNKELFLNKLLGRGDAGGFYDWFNHKIVTYKEEPLYTEHEILHAATRGNRQIPDKTKKILKKTYKQEGFFKNTEDLYYLSPTERLVRLQLLRADLNRRKIYKYGEKFTEEHYKKMMEEYESGNLAKESIDFIYQTQPDFKTFKELFENIAKNEQDGEKKIV